MLMICDGKNYIAVFNIPIGFILVDRERPLSIVNGIPLLYVYSDSLV